MENVAFVAFGDPKQALAPVHIVRKSLEEILKSLHGKRLRALERERLETVRAQVAVAGVVMAGRNFVAAVT
jgi:ABC-type dipeptide/oligopeptide/nickel transport system ATPase subunit